MQAKFNSENPPLDNEFFSELVGTDSDLSGTIEHPHDLPADAEGGDIEEQRTTIPLHKQGGVKSLLILGLSAVPIGGLGYMMFGNSGQNSPTVAATPTNEPTAPKAEFAPDPRFATMQNKLAMQDQTRGLEDAAKAQEAERLAKAAADAKATAATPNPQATPVTPAPAVTPVTSSRSAPPTNVEPPIAPVTKPVAVAPAITPAPQPRVASEPKAKPLVVVAKPQPIAFKPQPVAKTTPQPSSQAKVAIVKPQPAPATEAIVPKQPVSWQEATDNAIGIYGEKTVSKTVTQTTPESVQKSVVQPIGQPMQPQTIAQPIPQPVTQPVTSQIYQQPVVRSNGQSSYVPVGRSSLQPLVQPAGQLYPQQILPLGQPSMQPVRQLVPQASTIKNAAANYIASIDPRSYSEAIPQPGIEPDYQPVDRAISQYSGEKDNYKDNKTFTVAQAIVIPGQNRIVSLISPMQIIPGEAGQEILLQLEQGFADTNGDVPIPDGTRIIATVTVASNGLMRISSAIAIVNGENIPIDAGSLILSGTDNSPVIAQYKQFDQGEIGRRDLQTFLAGAASGLGRVLTQPNSSVQVSTNGTAVVSSTSNPNIVGGILDGGATPILEAWSKRNETEIRRLESASRLWYLPMGYKMTIVAVKPFAVR
ncbi:hypothetical protein [Chamaesiphon polymorphus]|uniref:Conjugal transfer protein TrbI n=1 Tax=Chamaesiphon polymorphus CCALA 037 TaxID=2107692 RepID=A0A2T1GML3_9CYAN|nr:hypothetical protein [Chamaesiphon polymorphus]PSB59144.1 hypothetical protein C7B77_02105 [Chamaesiphon polymorphus CCALA 037]